MIKGILFDKDGTLIKLQPMWHQIYMVVFERMETQWGISKQDIMSLQQKSGYTCEGFQQGSCLIYLSTTEIAQNWAKDLSSKYSLIGDEADFTQKIIRDINQAATDDRVLVEPAQGAIDLLTYLAGKQYKLGVATADTRVSTEYCLQKAGLFDFFSFIGYDGAEYRLKPDPQMAVLFCEAAGICPDELLVVGDSDVDLRFAKNAGASFAGLRAYYNGLDSAYGDGIVIVDSIADIVREMRL